jgi:hypothetical protein
LSIATVLDLERKEREKIQKAKGNQGKKKDEQDGGKGVVTVRLLL